MDIPNNTSLIMYLLIETEREININMTHEKMKSEKKMVFVIVHYENNVKSMIGTKEN